MIKSFLRTAKGQHFLSNIGVPRCPFTIYSNQHQRAIDFIDEKTVKYDINIAEYDRVIQAYIDKRWTKKEELRINKDANK